MTICVFLHDYVNYGCIQNLCGNKVMTGWSEEHTYPKLLEGRHVIHYCVPVEGLLHAGWFSYIMPSVSPYQHLLIVMTTHLTIKCLALTTLKSDLAAWVEDGLPYCPIFLWNLAKKERSLWTKNVGGAKWESVMVVSWSGRPIKLCRKDTKQLAQKLTTQRTHKAPKIYETRDFWLKTREMNSIFKLPVWRKYERRWVQI